MEEVALQDLLSDSSIVIRPCDKGSGICILDSEDYIEKIECELKDSSTYKQTDHDLTEEITRKVEKLVNKLRRKNYITDEIKRYMLPKNVRPGQVKGNPKMHKEGTPYRVIISGLNHPTENIAEYAEKQLQDHVKSLPSFIKDTTDFINKINELQQPLPENSILFCMDVKSLYPSVPKEEGLQACKIALDKRTNQDVPTDEIITTLLLMGNTTYSWTVLQ